MIGLWRSALILIKEYAMNFFLLKRGIVLLSIGTMAIASNRIENVLYHQGNTETTNIELAHLVFYFGQKPLVDVKNTGKTSHGMQQVVLTLPHVSIDNSLIKKAAVSLRDSFSVKISQIPDATQIFIQYDPAKIIVSYDMFYSISMEPRMVINFFNKDLIKTLQNREKSILSVTSLGPRFKKKVVVDMGHGGTDSGTSAYGLKEKDITLCIGQRLAHLLKAGNIDVIVTRYDDQTLTLDERTSIANNSSADIFISIHANYASNDSIAGIETFCSQQTLFTELDGSSSFKDLALVKKYVGYKYDAGCKLAMHVHNNLIQKIGRKYHDTCDRKVKKAALQVTLGTQMPAALVEVGFLSNKKEASRLKLPAYQELIALGIFQGITSYFKIYG